MRRAREAGTTALAGDGLAARGGEEEAGAGELAAGHRQRAVVEVDPEHVVGLVRQPPVAAQEMRQRAVAVAGRLLGAGDRGIDRDAVVRGEEAHEAHDLADRLARGVAGEHQIGDDDGAGVDEGVAGSPVLGLELDDRVEGGARGLAPDMGPEALAVPAEGEGQQEHLGDALDRERDLRVAGRVHRAVEGGDRQAEAVRVDAGELGDVVGDAPSPRRGASSACVASTMPCKSTAIGCPFPLPAAGSLRGGAGGGKAAITGPRPLDRAFPTARVGNSAKEAVAMPDRKTLLLTRRAGASAMPRSSASPRPGGG